MLVLGTALATGFTLLPPAAEAQGHGGKHGGGHGGGRVVYVGGFYGPGWGYGLGPWWGFGPYWGPYGYYGAAAGVDMNAAMIAGFGALKLNVKPDHADVWVDGKYVSEARDLDGYPSYLWLAEGGHRLAVYKGGFLVFDEPVEVRRGMMSEIKIRLQPGDSPPPGPKPFGKSADKPGEKKQE